MRFGPHDGPCSRGRIRGVVAAAVTLLAAAAAPAAAAEPPARIVSMNPCTDQLVWMLAGPERIVSLSHLAKDKEVSTIAAEVDVPHYNHGEAEEIIPLRPDLVFNGPFSHKAAADLLRKLGYPVVEMAPANSLADIRLHLRQMGDILGETKRAEHLIEQMDTRIAALELPRASRRPTAANYQPNGFTAGRGTLIADILEHAGFKLPGADSLRLGYSHLPLEHLIANPPDVLVIDNSYEDSPTLAQTLLGHPVLGRLGERTLRVKLPNRLWLCGTPNVVRAIELLADIRQTRFTLRGTKP